MNGPGGERGGEARNWRGLAIGLVLGVAVLGLIVYGALRMMKNSSLAPPPREQTITVIPQAPPPPPPPKEEPPPPPEEQPKLEEPTPKDEPQQDQADADQAPAGDDLGVDANGSGSGDGCGLVGKKGGRGLVGGGDRNRWFAGRVQQELQRTLAESEAMRGLKYSMVIKLWFKADGAVDRFDLQGLLPDAKSDAAFRQVVGALKLAEAPPEDMPQPIRLRVVSR